MRPWRSDCSTPMLLATLLLLCASSSLADPEAEAGTGSTESSSASPEAESESDKLRASFESLHEAYASRQNEIAALEFDATTAVGEDQIALRGLALELMLEEAHSLKEMWALIEQMEAADDTHSTRHPVGVLAALSPVLRDSIRSAIGSRP